MSGNSFKSQQMNILAPYIGNCTFDRLKITSKLLKNEQLMP